MGHPNLVHMGRTTHVPDGLVQCGPMSTTRDESDATDTAPGNRSTWGEIDGVTIEFPMVVEELRSATLTFTVALDAARALLPGDAFEVAEVAPGSAMLVLALCDYVRNPWGDYDEVNAGLLVHPVGRPDAVGAFQWRMPVDQEFTCAAGNRVMGLPKTVEDLAFDYSGAPEPVGDGGTVTVRLAMADEPAGGVTLLVELPRPEASHEVLGTDKAMTYSYLDGEPMELALDMQLPPSFVDPATVRIELGAGAFADDLRSLGLPKAPDLAMWGEGLAATFQRPVPLGDGAESAGPNG